MDSIILWLLINNQSVIPSTDVTQLTLTLKMTTAQVVETSVTVNNNSPIQDYVHPDDQTQPFVNCIVNQFDRLNKPIPLTVFPAPCRTPTPFKKITYLVS